MKRISPLHTRTRGLARHARPAAVRVGTHHMRRDAKQTANQPRIGRRTAIRMADTDGRIGPVERPAQRLVGILASPMLISDTRRTVGATHPDPAEPAP
ncbi:hypothetical protein [Burkholderia stabilis]|uniref:hypothetical protein n=1 Tax=Burkholderia stabilis TaxID=95485 RepID=UPI0012EA5925|nr:hypothetical protein [Burkholderia stabilis]HDR9490271.1 hypothetical protein [Burkholderia stabilis]HDR9521358.1 hypothetical protein [Burkholderia stabilis]HDR9529826.1 hypothetical protein [Burkholderia stabilis]HDR9537376.1 hypothetical protein [Burkholderia stabilis]HDR9548330.1 hypothetical protein [Burkholderia stabilis]